MKALFFIALLSLTVANALVSGVVETENAPSSIVEYKTAFFAEFNLKAPTQMLKCFDNKYAYPYFKRLDLIQRLAHHTEKRENIRARVVMTELTVLQKFLNSLDACIFASQDFSDLMTALGMKGVDAKEFTMLYSVFYQARFGMLDTEMLKITKSVDDKKYKEAGEQTAKFLKMIAEDFKSKGVALLALDAVWDGVHIGLGLSDAESVFECFNNETASVRMEFIYSLASYVSKGLPKDAYNSTELFYKEKGNDLVKKIPETAWKCWKESKDTKMESAKLGLDISGPEFYAKVKKHAMTHTAAYYRSQVDIKKGIDELNLHQAGAAYAGLMKAAASMK